MDNVWLYVTQILLVISSIGIALANNKKKIYYINLAFNALCLVMYILQGNTESGAVYAVITIRSILYAFHKNESDKYIPIACTIAQFAISSAIQPPSCTAGTVIGAEPVNALNTS